MAVDTLTRRRAVALLLSPIAALVGRSVPSALAAPRSGTAELHAAETTTSGYCPAGEELVFLGLINSYRKSKGLSSLRLSRTLGAAAEHHSQDMARYNYFGHTLANGRTWSSNITAHGYSASSTIGENIAAGNRTASATFTQWRNSPGHNANMLNPKYRAIGIGRASSSSSKYGYYWTTTFGGAFDASPTC